MSRLQTYRLLSRVQWGKQSSTGKPFNAQSVPADQLKGENGLDALFPSTPPGKKSQGLTGVLRGQEKQTLLRDRTEDSEEVRFSTFPVGQLRRCKELLAL
jgi:hypothetical protein